MKGQCLCGAVSVAIPHNEHVGVCHCGMCRRWNGGPFFALYSETMEISGEEHITRYPSSEWAERAFCNRCGTHLYYHLLGGNHYEISVGLFPNEQHFTLQEEIYIDSKPDFYALTADVPQLTEADVLKKYGF